MLCNITQNFPLSSCSYAYNSLVFNGFSNSNIFSMVATIIQVYKRRAVKVGTVRNWLKSRLAEEKGVNQRPTRTSNFYKNVDGSKFYKNLSIF